MWSTSALVYAAVLTACAMPFGRYIQRVFDGEQTWASRILRPLEVSIYRLCGVDTAAEMSWGSYASAVLALTLVGTLALYALLRLQTYLPLNPQHFGAVDPVIAWNTAVSFVTTTDWQFFAGENTLGYFAQMAGLAWQNFVAGAAGLAAGIAVIRGFSRERSSTIGNFWVDFVRSLLYVLLPLSLVFGLLFVASGVPQNFNAYIQALSPERFAQTITGGPMASQEATSLLGGNGGGFVAANTTSPNLNPNGISNFLELLSIWLIPAALPFTFGRMVRNERQGYALFAAMAVVAIAGLGIAQWAELAGNPLVHHLGVAGANMEGKETRFGAENAGLSLAVASNSGTGASNFAYDSLMPIGGLVAMVNMQLGEVIFGGVGSGIYGMLMFAVITVFIAGLMVGRTPEYLGKKIEQREITYAMLAALVFPAMILIAAAVAAVIPQGLQTLSNDGAHGFSEIVYAFTSTAANNGSAFAGLGPNPFYDFSTGLLMLGGRFLVMIPTLALAGALAARPTNRLGAGTFRTDNGLFVALLVGVIVIFGALTFLPADALGPIAEHVTLFHL
jgi:K+-transporting ATPase ATPase A chain